MRGVSRPLATIGAALLVCGCSLLERPDVALPWEELDLEPRIVDPQPLAHIPTGPVVEVLRGSINGGAVSITAHQDPSGLCIGTGSATQSGMSCGLAPGEDPDFGRFGMLSGGATGQGVPVEVAGVVASDVAAVGIELADGRRARALLVPLAPAEIDAHLFLAYLPADAIPAAVVALDEEGAILDRFSLMPAPAP